MYLHYNFVSQRDMMVKFAAFVELFGTQPEVTLCGKWVEGDKLEGNEVVHDFTDNRSDPIKHCTYNGVCVPVGNTETCVWDRLAWVTGVAGSASFVMQTKRD